MSPRIAKASHFLLILLIILFKNKTKGARAKKLAKPSQTLIPFGFVILDLKSFKLVQNRISLPDLAFSRFLLWAPFDLDSLFPSWTSDLLGFVGMSRQVCHGEFSMPSLACGIHRAILYEECHMFFQAFLQPLHDNLTIKSLRLTRQYL